MLILRLGNNNLDGSIPPEIGNLAKLERFNVESNPELEGVLPASLTKIMLTEFLAGDTALCAPADHSFTGFLAWLNRIRTRSVRRCER